MVWSIFENWWFKDSNEKVTIVKNCLQKGIIVDENNSGLEVDEIERLATQSGVPFVKVWKTFTDVAGMRDKAAGVALEGLTLEIGTSLRKG